MKSLIRILVTFAPEAIKRRELRRLFSVTASGFGSPVPALAGLSFDQCLMEYARFTRTESLKLCTPGASCEDACKRLFSGGESLGRRVRKMCRIASLEEAVCAMSILYSTIGIRAGSNEESAMDITSCYFAGIYSPEICSIMSSLDDGIFAGLSGGGRLRFGKRLTDCSDRCSAAIIPPEGGA
jgi:hypothetical protein